MLTELKRWKPLTLFHSTAKNERQSRRERFLASVRVQAMLANHPFIERSQERRKRWRVFSFFWYFSFSFSSQQKRKKSTLNKNIIKFL